MRNYSRGLKILCGGVLTESLFCGWGEFCTVLTAKASRFRRKGVKRTLVLLTKRLFRSLIAGRKILLDFEYWFEESDFAIVVVRKNFRFRRKIGNVPG